MPNLKSANKGAKAFGTGLINASMRKLSAKDAISAILYTPLVKFELNTILPVPEY